ncbi:unnamed protein product, partial [Schistocephalus solidus]|uniref:PX domain-containing protein n=1 Tax=Schistocephalus solidus TaxID=70667 RepID=A0A183ST94_SCHSO
EYDIEICHPAGHCWCVTRRYREFRALRDAVSSSIIVPLPLRRTPQSHWHKMALVGEPKSHHRGPRSLATAEPRVLHHLNQHQLSLCLIQQLHSAYNLPEDVTLPSRKLFNNLSRAFVYQRSRDLEAFLNRLLAHYTLPPAPLAAFIDWDRYDIHGITNCLARQLSKGGETILSRNLLYSMQVYQLSAVNRRVISPVAPILSSVFPPARPLCAPSLLYVPFASFRDFQLIGSIEKLHKSNVTINSLNFDMSPFKRLKYLELINVELKRMRGFECIKGTMTELIVHHSLKNLRNLMLGDLYAAGGGDWVYGETPVSTLPWNQIKMADFSNNFLHSIDQTITLLPMVEILNLSNNLLTELAPLTCLPYLRVLYVSGNQLYIGEEAGLDLPSPANGLPELQSGGDTTSLDAKASSEQPTVVLGTAASASTSGASELSSETRKTSPPPLHTRLGEIHVLALANNGLRSAILVAGINSLQHLDLSDNKIDSFAELVCLGSLPHLSSVDLSGNPICGNPYYRRNTLDLLGLRFTLVSGECMLILHGHLSIIKFPSPQIKLNPTHLPKSLMQIALDGQRATRQEIEIVELYRALKRGGVTLCSQLPAVCAPTTEVQKESTTNISTSGQNDQPVSIFQCNPEVPSCTETAMAHGDPGPCDSLTDVDLRAKKESPGSVRQSEKCKSDLLETDIFQPNNNLQSSSTSPNVGCQAATESSLHEKSLSSTEKDLRTHSVKEPEGMVTTGHTGASPKETLQSTEPPTIPFSALGNANGRENFSDATSSPPDDHFDREVTSISSSAPDKVAASKLQPRQLPTQGANTLPSKSNNDASPSDFLSNLPCGSEPYPTSADCTPADPTTMSVDNVDYDEHRLVLPKETKCESP